MSRQGHINQSVQVRPRPEDSSLVSGEAPWREKRTLEGIGTLDWRAFEKNTLRGFFDVRLPCGMILHGLTLHEKNGSRWVGLPAREYTKDGRQGFARIVEFSSHERANSFRDACLAALDNRQRLPFGGAK